MKRQPVSPLDPFLILKYFLVVFSIAFRVGGKRLILSLLAISSVVMVVVVARDSIG